MVVSNGRHGVGSADITLKVRLPDLTRLTRSATFEEPVDVSEPLYKAAAELLPKTFSVIDKSAKSGVIKKNTAALYKSKLHLRVKALAA